MSHLNFRADEYVVWEGTNMGPAKQPSTGRAESKQLLSVVVRPRGCTHAQLQSFASYSDYKLLYISHDLAIKRLVGSTFSGARPTL